VPVCDMKRYFGVFSGHGKSSEGTRSKSAPRAKKGHGYVRVLVDTQIFIAEERRGFYRSAEVQLLLFLMNLGGMFSSSGFIPAVFILSRY
jgi:hypothetical protein